MLMVNGPLQENTSLKLWRKCYYGKLWKFFCSFKKPLEVNSPKFAHFKKHCWRHDSWFWRLFLCIYTFYFSFHHESQVREQQRSPTESDRGRVPSPGCNLRRWHQQGRQGLLQRPFCKGERGVRCLNVLSCNHKPEWEIRIPKYQYWVQECVTV